MQLSINKIFLCFVHADFDLALETAWHRNIPEIVSEVQRKLDGDALFLRKVAAKVERRYQMARHEAEVLAESSEG